MLEVRDEELTVKTNDGSTVIVSWKLAHIRSFKAKKDMLTVYSGRYITVCVCVRACVRACVCVIFRGHALSLLSIQYYVCEAGIMGPVTVVWPCMVRLNYMFVCVQTHANSHTLTCSRSSTGVGEYYFKTSQSVQITHAIETVVKKLKLEALGSNQQVHDMYVHVCLLSHTSVGWREGGPPSS